MNNSNLKKENKMSRYENINCSEAPIKNRLRNVKNLIGNNSDNNLKTLISQISDTETAESGIKKNVYNIFDVIGAIGGKLMYIKSGTTGHTFKGTINDKVNYAVKVVAYPKEKRYPDMKDETRPENAELKILKILSQFVIMGKTPHIVLPIFTFNTSIDTFIELKTNGSIRDKKYDEFVAKYENDEFDNLVSILISEWADGGDLLDYIRNNIDTMKMKTWKIFIFQILSVLSVIHMKYPDFRHNDMKANNILIHNINIQTDNDYFQYEINNKQFFLPNIGHQIRIWDFDFACIKGIAENAKVNLEWTNRINITNKCNRYYDICFLFASIQSFIKNFRERCLNGGNGELLDFIDSIVPRIMFDETYNILNEKGRLMYNIEYTTPTEILLNHPFFNKFRKKEDRVSNFIPSGVSKLNDLINEIKQNNRINNLFNNIEEKS